jgi:hypothetical protein
VLVPDSAKPTSRPNLRRFVTYHQGAPKRSDGGLVVVLVLDLLGFCVETRPDYSRTISFYQRDRENSRAQDEHEHDLLNFGIWVKRY